LFLVVIVVCLIVFPSYYYFVALTLFGWASCFIDVFYILVSYERIKMMMMMMMMMKGTFYWLGLLAFLSSAIFKEMTLSDPD